MNFESDEGDDGDYGPDTSLSIRPPSPSIQELRDRERIRRLRDRERQTSSSFNRHMIDLFNSGRR